MIKTEVCQLEEEIHQCVKKLETQLLKTSQDEEYAKSQLAGRLTYIKWAYDKYKLRSEKSPTVIRQREIFYCHLGVNIGSEQNYKRPVVILQNNIGNKMGKTTIIAPITTYDSSIFYKKDPQTEDFWVQYTDDSGQLIDRKLDFYEIPIEIEEGSRHQITGIINVVHIREVSTKRLFKIPVATISIPNFSKVIAAINYNLSPL